MLSRFTLNFFRGNEAEEVSQLLLVNGVSPHRPKFDSCAFNVGFLVNNATKRHVSLHVLEFSTMLHIHTHSSSFLCSLDNSSVAK
jgi:hypothetical protein